MLDIEKIKPKIIEKLKILNPDKIILRDIIMNYKTNGIDILSSSQEFINSREDYFYKIDILQNGKVWYEQKVS